jgi:methylglyoxal reductase
MPHKHLLGGVGLGTFPFAGGFSPVDTSRSIDLMRAYLEGGGTYIDTAPTYASGHVEQLVGDAVAVFPRNAFFVNTSCGYVRDGNSFAVSGKREHVFESCANSLRRLNLDFVDSYISHIPDINTPFNETMEAMRDLVGKGLVRALGVSNVTLEQLKAYQSAGVVSYVQNRFSLLNRSFSQEFLEYCESNNIGLIAYQVLERGLLTDTTDEKLGTQSGSLRRRKPEFAQNVQSIIRPWVKTRLRPIALSNGITTATLAICWAKQQQGIALAQCGVTNHDQLSQILAARHTKLSAKTLDEIDQAYHDLEAEVENRHKSTVREFMGLAAYDIYSGSTTGK